MPDDSCKVLRLDEWAATTDLFGELIDLAPMPIALMDRQHCYVRVNRAYAQADRRVPSEYPGRNHFDLHPCQVDQAAFGQVVQTGRSCIVLDRPGRQDDRAGFAPGGWAWRLLPVKDRPGTVVGLVMIAINATDRARAAAGLQAVDGTTERQIRVRTADLDPRRQDALRPEAAPSHVERQETMRAVLETTRAVPWQADACSLQITFIGPQVEELLGYPQDAWFEEGFWQSRLHPEDRDRVVNRLRIIAEGNHDSDLEYRMVAGDGLTVWIHDRVQAVLGGVARPLLRGIKVDITDRKEAEQQTRQLQEELWHASRVASLGEFSGSLAHELNQPLAAILSNAQAALRLLSASPPNLAEVAEAVSEIVQDDRRASQIIQRLRDLLRKGPANRTAVNINVAVQDVFALLHEHSVARNVLVRLALTDPLPPIWGDRIQVQQVIFNLVRNAVEAVVAVPSGRREVVVSTCIHGHGMVRVAIRDSGVGAAGKMIEEMFTPFYTTKPGGLGIGLPVSRSIISAHGGRIWATANEDEGITVQFTLPVAEGSSS